MTAPLWEWLVAAAGFVAIGYIVGHSAGRVAERRERRRWLDGNRRGRL